MSGLKSCNDGDELKSSTKSHDIRLWQIACHEAGHAVIAAILDILGDQSVVTIVPEGCVTGSVEFSRDTSNNAWKQWGMRYTRQAILASYAGPAVSIKLDHGLDLFEEGGWNELDMTGAQDFCRWIGDPAYWCYEPDKHLIFETRHWKKAVALVEQNWPAIKFVADELLNRKTIRGNEVKQLLKRMAKLKAPAKPG